MSDGPRDAESLLTAHPVRWEVWRRPRTGRGPDTLVESGLSTMVAGGRACVKSVELGLPVASLPEVYYKLLDPESGAVIEEATSYWLPNLTAIRTRVGGVSA